MIDVRRRRDEQRLRRAQEIADCARERQAELRLELRDRSLHLRAEPVELAAYRRTGSVFGGFSLPDDVC
jgi:hypothetical protein